MLWRSRTSRDLGERAGGLVGGGGRVTGKGVCVPPASLPMTIVHPSPWLDERAARKDSLLVDKNCDSALILARRTGSRGALGAGVEAEANGARRYGIILV